MSNRILLVIALLFGAVSASSLQATPFSDANWSSPGGANGPVHATAVDGSGNLYIGGNFTAVGNVSITNIAKWDGNSWSALGAGVDGPVFALAGSGSDVYAGGAFSTAGGSSAANIAKWNGTNWSALGSGITGYVYALATSGTHLYVGGDFNNAGGNPAACIAKWDGSSWSTLGGLTGGQVFGLAVAGNNLYACGAFVSASSPCCGSVQVNGIARWDENVSYWSALGTGMNNWVLSVAVSGSDVYAGGFFNYAGGNQINAIAKWNGFSWSALGTGLYGQVFAITVSGSDMYAGGGFNGLSGPPNNVGKWNGTIWSGLGSGVDGGVNALTVSGTNLYAGGTFNTAGGKASPSVARAVLGDAPGYNQLTGQSLPNGDVQLSYVGYPAIDYALDRAFQLSPPVSWVGQRTNTISLSGVILFTNTPVSGTNNFWRVRSVP